MLRLARLEVLQPNSWDEAVACLQKNPQARVLAEELAHRVGAG